HFAVKYGKSHPRIRFHAEAEKRSAVAMPPSGPTPATASGMTRRPSDAQRSGEPITVTAATNGSIRRAVRTSNGTPLIASRALSRPMRELTPPARMNPATWSCRFMKGWGRPALPCGPAATGPVCCEMHDALNPLRAHCFCSASILLAVLTLGAISAGAYSRSFCSASILLAVLTWAAISAGAHSRSRKAPARLRTPSTDPRKAHGRAKGYNGGRGNGLYNHSYGHF